MSNKPSDDAALSESEIQRRMDAGMKRALSTPPTPTKKLIGKTERAQAQRETRKVRASRPKPKGDEGA